MSWNRSEILHSRAQDTHAAKDYICEQAVGVKYIWCKHVNRNIGGIVPLAPYFENYSDAPIPFSSVVVVL